jgi:hypothetical protein
MSSRKCYRFEYTTVKPYVLCNMGVKQGLASCPERRSQTDRDLFLLGLFTRAVSNSRLCTMESNNRIINPKLNGNYMYQLL